MDNQSATTEKIRTFLLKKFPGAKKQRLDIDVPLLQSGIVDSLGVLDIVAYIEQTFAISVSDEELSPDNFSSISALASFVSKKQSVNEAATT